MRATLLTTALVLPIACSDGALAPVAHEAAPSLQAARSFPTDVAGTYAAVVDFSTVTLTPRGRNCRLVVQGELIFSGSIVGTADATTSALIFAPCDAVATTPPGTFRDVFTSDLHFTGTVNGVPAESDGLYQGVTEVGGAIRGRIHFSNGIAGVVDVDAFVAVGGTYEGSVVVR